MALTASSFTLGSDIAWTFAVCKILENATHGVRFCRLDLAVPRDWRTIRIESANDLVPVRIAAAGLAGLYSTPEPTMRLKAKILEEQGATANPDLR